MNRIITPEEYLKKPKNSKYRNKKIINQHGVFDSKKEANRYAELALLERAGMISDLKRQIKYELIPAQFDKQGRHIERSVTYIADAVYTENGKTIVEDTKGLKTDAYIMKRKLMLHIHGIKLRET